MLQFRTAAASFPAGMRSLAEVRMAELRVGLGAVCAAIGIGFGFPSPSWVGNPP